MIFSPSVLATTSKVFFIFEKSKKLHLIFNKISQIKENATPIGQEQYY
jgi:hypothetical protein